MDEEDGATLAGGKFEDSTDFTFLTRRMGTQGRAQGRFSGRPLSPLVTATKQAGRPLISSLSQKDVIKQSLANLDKVTTPQVTPQPESRAKTMMDTPQFVETPQAGDLSMSFTCIAPELPTLNQTPTFMDLTNVTREQSFYSTPIVDDGMTLQTIEFLGLQQPVQDNAAYKETWSNLLKVFHQCYTNKPNNEDILDLVKSYEMACDAQIKWLAAALKRQDQYSRNKLMNMQEELALECGTWQLIYVLFSDRLSMYNDDQNDATVDSMMDIDPSGHISSKEAIEKLYQKDSGVRQCQLVIDWLEKLAEPKLDTTMKISYAADTVAWENTLQDLQSAGEEVPSNMVSSMDPDAPLREKKPLSDLDEAAERMLSKHLFRCIRAGKLAKAEEVCCSIGQFWKAATLEGWKLFHDPNITDEGYSEEVHPLEGNSCRGLWKESCWHMIREAGLDNYENAMYAALIGDLDHMLPVCDSWHDYLWAYYKTMVETIVEQQLKKITPGRGENELTSLLPPSKTILSPELIFQEIRACKLKAAQQGATCPYRVVQRDVILYNMQSLVNEMYTAIKNKNESNIQLLRFMAHVVLFIQGLGVAISEDSKCVEILEMFIMSLIRASKGELVAAYAAALPTELQIRCYSELLEGVTVSSERQQYLILADKAGLDTASITRNVVHNICSQWDQDYPHDVPLYSVADITTDDLKKIKSIEWLVFDQAQRLDVLVESNTLIRQFLARGKYHAAVEAFNVVPLDAQEMVVGQTDKEVPDDVQNIIHEHLCIHAYLDAQEAFNTWIKDFHESKPAVSKQSSSNTVDQFRHAEKRTQYQREVSQWKVRLTHSTQDVVQKIKDVLLFSPDGWMVDLHPTDTSDTRTHQMKLLRQICLPKMCVLLHKVLHSVGRYKECMEVGDMVASTRYKLYEVFHQNELDNLLSLLRETSLEILSAEPTDTSPAHLQ